MTFHHLDWYYHLVKMSRLRNLSQVVYSCSWFILNINSSILVNVNFPHLYIVQYEDGNSDFNILILTRHLFDDLNGFQSYPGTEIKYKITLEYITISIRTS